MVVVEWTDEPYVGKTQAILARTIIEPPLEQLKDGGQVRVKMGKSTSAREWKAVFRGTVDDSIETERPTCEANAGDEDATKKPKKATENVRGRKRLASKKGGGKKKSKQQGTKQVATTEPKTKKVLTISFFDFRSYYLSCSYLLIYRRGSAFTK